MDTESWQRTLVDAPRLEEARRRREGFVRTTPVFPTGHDIRTRSEDGQIEPDVPVHSID